MYGAREQFLGKEKERALWGGGGGFGGFGGYLGNRTPTTRAEKVLKRARHPLSRTPENWRF